MISPVLYIPGAPWTGNQNHMPPADSSCCSLPQRRGFRGALPGLSNLAIQRRFRIPSLVVHWLVKVGVLYRARSRKVLNNWPMTWCWVLRWSIFRYPKETTGDDDAHSLQTANSAKMSMEGTQAAALSRKASFTKQVLNGLFFSLSLFLSRSALTLALFRSLIHKCLLRCYLQMYLHLYLFEWWNLF